MDLQWRALFTQVVGFLIVVWLLRKFAWDKLIAFIEHRREVIANEFENIEKTKADAGELKAQFEKELADIESTRRARIQDGVQEANAHAAEIKEEARKEALELRDKTARDIELDMDKANVELRDRMVAAVVTTAERLIQERLDDDKHRALINRFLDEVNLTQGNQQR